MSFFDNDPPKHLDVGSLTREDSVNVYKAGSGKPVKYFLSLSLEEVGALVAHGETPFFRISTNSKKEYKKALEIQNRARRYIEEDKLIKTQNDDHTL